MTRRTSTNMLKRIFAALVLVFAFSATPALAQENVPENEYMTGKVSSIVEEEREEIPGFANTRQVILVEITSGSDSGSVQTLEYNTTDAGGDNVLLKEGQSILLVRSSDALGTVRYAVVDKFRLPSVAVFGILFFLLAIALGRWRGFMSLLGLGVSLAVLSLFVVPQILGGASPLLICGIGAVMIAVVSILLAHGFNRRSGIALASTLIALGIAFIIASLSVAFSMLSGASSEEAVYLQLGYLSSLDLRGLLLGGIVIGALGVLDDVTTAQVAAVEEIHRANPALDIKELYKRGLSVGREHIASLVNTLALAYVGASFPLFLLFTMPDAPPLWVTLNSESVVEEMLRALVGGSALMLAVPIATAIAAYFFGRDKYAA